MNKILVSIKQYLLLIFIISSIFISILVIKNITPFGTNTLLTGDFKIQYAPIIYDFRNRLINGNLIYSFTTDMGKSYAGTYFTYLSSPLNLLVLFFNKNNLTNFFTLIIYLRFILSGITMLYYLRNKFKTKSNKLIIPSLIYSLSGYLVSYYFNINFTSACVLLPLIILGIEHIVNNLDTKLFVFSLTIQFYINYYMAYMLSILSIIYLICYNLYKIKGNTIIDKLNNYSKNILLTIKSFILIFLLCLPMVTQVYTSLQIVKNIGGGFPTKILYNFNLIDFISNLFINNTRNMGVSFYTHTSPYIYISILGIFLLIIFIFNKKIDIKTKILYLSLVIILILIMRIPILDFIINAFHLPNGYQYRYSFFLIFITCVMITYSILNLNYNKLIIFISSILLILFQIYLYINNLNFISNKYKIINIIFVLIYMFILLINNKNTYKLLLPVLIIELFINTYPSIINNTSTNLFSTSNLSFVKEIHDDDFNRLYVPDYLINESLYNYSFNLLTNTYGISVFDSSANGNVTSILSNLGATGSISVGLYQGNSQLLNDLFSVKYTYSNLSDNNLTSTYSNTYNISNNYLGLIYGTNILPENNTFTSDNIFENQNKLIKDMTGVDNIFEKSDIINKKLIYEDDNYLVYNYELLTNNNYYYFTNDNNISFIYENNIISTPYNEYESIWHKSCLSNINNINKILYKYSINFKNNITIGEFKKKNNINQSDYIYHINYDNYQKALNILKSKKVTINNFMEDRIDFTTDFKNKQYLFTSIPYESGWSLYIDGKKETILKSYDTFISFKVPSGKHDIKLKYNIPYLKISIIISLITLILSIIYIKRGELNERNSRNKTS